MYLNIYQIHFLILMTCYHIHQAISAAINAKPAPLRVLVPTLATNFKVALTTAFETTPFERPATRATPAPIPVASMKQSLKEPPLVWDLCRFCRIFASLSNSAVVDTLKLIDKIHCRFCRDCSGFHLFYLLPTASKALCEFVHLPLLLR